MVKNISIAGPISASDTVVATVPIAARPTVTVPPIANVAIPSTVSTSAISMLLAYAKPFPYISRIEVFFGINLKRWQEHIYSTLDMHGVAWLLSAENMHVNTKVWAHANKVCQHTILITLSNKLFDFYCAYKEVNVIWESMLTKYTTQDVSKQKFVVGNYYKWELVDNKDIKLQIN